MLLRGAGYGLAATAQPIPNGHPADQVWASARLAAVGVGLVLPADLLARASDHAPAMAEMGLFTTPQVCLESGG